MTLTADEYAESFAYDLHLHTLTSDRSQQQADGVIGASDFDCPERMRRILLKQPHTDAPSRWAAFVGTALDREIKEARKAGHPELLHDIALTLEFPNGFTITVHPDELDPSEPSYTDYKSKNGLALERRTHTADQARIQRNLNYLAAWQNKVLPHLEGVVRNVSVDRSGKDDRPHVEQEPFSADVVNQAYDLLKDVLYAVEHGEEARKDRPHYWCQRFCPFFTACRANDAPELYRRDDALAEIAALRYEWTEMGHLAEEIGEEARDELAGFGAPSGKGFTGIVEGAAGRYRVRTTVVNAKTGSYSKVEVSAA